MNEKIYKNVVAYPEKRIIEFKGLGEGYKETKRYDKTLLNKRWREANKIAKGDPDITSGVSQINITPENTFLEGYKGGMLNIAFQKRDPNGKLLLESDYSKNELGLKTGRKVGEKDWKTSCILNGNKQVYIEEGKKIHLPRYLLERPELTEEVEEYIKETIDSKRNFNNGSIPDEPEFIKNGSLLSVPKNSWEIYYKNEKGKYKRFKAGVIPDFENNSIITYLYNFIEKPTRRSAPLDIEKTGSSIDENIEISLEKSPDVEIYREGELEEFRNIEDFIDKGVKKPSKGLKEALKTSNRSFGQNFNLSYFLRV